MSCAASVAVVAPDCEADRLLDLGIARVHRLEAMWSRFRPDSEVSRLNRRAGTPVVVSPETITLVEAMVQGWHVTVGSFDPTLLATLVELGYAQSREDATRRTSLPAGTAMSGRPGAIRLDRAASTVTLPEHTAIDPGVIGKGLAADLAVADLVADGAAGALVEIGGDLSAAGEPPDGGWTIAVDTGAAPATIRLVSGGVATSTSRLRRWERDGERRHHLVDPCTLQPSTNDVLSCSVVAGTAAWAEVFTKVAFARSVLDSVALFERHGLAASITRGDGRRVNSEPWDAFER
jgi:thiamine biosynthesis lipoprotein